MVGPYADYFDPGAFEDAYAAITRPIRDRAYLARRESDLAAFKAKLKDIRSIPMKPQRPEPVAS